VRNAYISDVGKYQEKTLQTQASVEGMTVVWRGRRVRNVSQSEASSGSFLTSCATINFSRNILYLQFIHTLLQPLSDYVSICGLLRGLAYNKAVCAGSKFPTEGARICTQHSSDEPFKFHSNRQQAILDEGNGSSSSPLSYT
jgi:hypothetical protein